MRLEWFQIPWKIENKTWNEIKLQGIYNKKFQQSGLLSPGVDESLIPWLIHVNDWQKQLQYCKVISLQLIKINEKKKKRRLWTDFLGIVQGAEWLPFDVVPLCNQAKGLREIRSPRSYFLVPKSDQGINFLKLLCKVPIALIQTLRF